VTETSKISVVIPCYNVADCVEASLNSVLGQTYQNVEIVCVDDGSQDDTLEMLEYFRDACPGRVRVLTGENRGAPAARNRGLAESDGPIIQFLDADDALAPDKLEHQIGLLNAAAEEPDLIAGAFVRKLLTGEKRMLRPEASDPWTALLRARLGVTSSNLWKRESVLAAGAWKEDMRSSQEYELMFRMLGNGARVLFDHEPLTLVNERPESISYTNRGDNWLRYIQLRRDIEELLRTNKMMTTERETALQEMLFRALRSLFPHAPHRAVELHNQLIPREFVPVGHSRPYRLLYHVLGFGFTERIRRLLHRQGN